MKRVLYARSVTAPSNSATSYANPAQSMAFSTTLAARTVPWIVAGTFDNFIVTLDVAPGAGKSWVFTLVINGSDTGITVTISDSATTARDILHTATIAVNDTVTLKAVPSGTPTTPGTRGVRTSLEFTGTTIAQSGYAIAGDALSTAAVRYTGLFDGDAYGTVATDVHNVAAAAGTITGMRATVSAQPGVGKSWTHVIYKNGVKQDGTGGTVNTTVTISDTATAASASFSLVVVGGDTFYVEVTPAGTPAAATGSVACAFTATTDGESQACGVFRGNPFTASTQYTFPMNNAQTSFVDTTEANMVFLGSVTAFSLTKLYVVLNGTPGSGKSYTFSTRLNSTSPGGVQSAAVTDLNTTASDTTGTIAIVDGNTFDIRVVPAGTPTSRHWSFGMIQTGAALLSPAVTPTTTASQSTFTTPAITGPQTIIGLGFKPKALVLWSDGQSAAGTTDGVQFTLGMTDGTRQAVRAVNSSDNVAASETSQAESDQRVIWFVGADETTKASASLVSFDTDGFTIIWNVNDGTARVVHYLALGGDAVALARVDHWTALTAPGSHSVTNVGFAPAGLLFLVSAKINPTTEQITDFGSFPGVGMATTSALANATSVVMIRDNQNPSDTYKRQRTDKSLIVSEIGLSGGAPRTQGAITGARFDGFDVTYDTASGDAYRLTYLAVAGCKVKVFTVTQPAAIGAQSITGIGFQPKSILLQSVGAVASSSTGNGAQLMLGVGSGAAQSVAVLADNDAVTPTVNARSHATNKIVRLLTPTATGSASTVVAEASLARFTSDGFNLDWTTTDGTGREFIGIAFGDASAVVIATDPTGGGTVGSGTDPAAGLSLCPVEVPIAWVELRPAGSSTTYRYAKVPINIDAFPKEPRVQSFGTIRRALSGAEGDFRGVAVSSTLIDTDRVLRGLEDSDSLIGARVAYYLSSEVAIRAGSTPRRVFDGIVTDTEPLGGLQFRIQAADYFGSLMEEFSAKRTIPQRVFSVDDFPYLAEPSPTVGYDGTGIRPGNPELIGKPIPIGYGLLSDESRGASAEGVVPTYFVGQRQLTDGFWWDEYVVFGHAVPGGLISTFGGMPVTDLWGSWTRLKSTADQYGIDIIAPGLSSLWASLTGSASLYRDINGHRYTVFYARGPRSWAASTGRVPWTVNCGGVESVGDATGTMIDGLFRQILHLFVNFVFGNYLTGAWLAPPVVPGDLYSRIKTSTFEALQTLSALYVTGGFKGAFILGVDGEVSTIRTILQQTAQSTGCEFGLNKDGQLIGSMVNPSATLNRAITDVTDVMKRSFAARRQRPELKNTVTYRYGRRYVQPMTQATPPEGQALPAQNAVITDPDWTTATPISDATSLSKYGERKLDLDMPFVRDVATATAVARLRLATLKAGPTMVTFNERLCGTSTDLGDRDTLTHFEGMTATGYTARSLRCESHTLDLDEISKTDSDGDVEKTYRDLATLDYSALLI